MKLSAFHSLVLKVKKILLYFIIVLTLLRVLCVLHCKKRLVTSWLWTEKSLTFFTVCTLSNKCYDDRYCCLGKPCPLLHSFQPLYRPPLVKPPGGITF
jgi:hypothetical protein